MRNLLFGLGLLVAPLASYAQLVAKNLTASNGVFIGFYQYTPSNYNSTSTKYPLIIFLHGIGERGNGTTDLSRIAGPAIPGYIRNKGWDMTFTWQGKTETFLVLAPQLSSNYGSWQDFYVDEMLKYAKANLRVDPNRIILTGLSLGGGGVWHYASNSAANASQFAAIAPVCGTCAVVNAANIANANLPVWAFHAMDDGTVGVGCTTGAIGNINKNNPAVTPLMTLYPSGGHGIWDKAYSKTYDYQNPTIYEWMLAQNKSLAPNKKPIAKAGSDVSITTLLGNITLSAGASYDPDGTVVRAIWRQISGPSSGLIATPGGATTLITGLTTAGTYKFELEVVDNRAEWAKDTVAITTTIGGIITPPPPAPTANSPTADAGTDVSVTLPTSSTSLNGSKSADPSGSIKSYQWTKIGGPSQYAIASPTAAVTAVNNLAQGTYQFRLVVANSSGSTDADTVAVTVNASGSNKAPTARAGSDVTVTLPTNSATLDGRWSSDPEKALKTFTWTKVSGPSQYSLTSKSTNGSLQSVTNLASGTYAFRLEVADAGGLKDDDTVLLKVNAATGAAAVSSSAIETGLVKDSVVVSPNPATTTLRVTFTSVQTGRITIIIYDATGRVISTTSAQKSSEQYTQTMNVGNYGNGVYYVGVTAPDRKQFTTKFIKQ